MSILTVVILLLVLIILGMDIQMCFLIAAITFTIANEGEITSFTLTSFTTNNNYSLLAVPLFMVGGTIMERSGIASSLVNWCEVMLRRFKSGMGAIIPLSSMAFGSMCGSSMATVSTIGTLLIDRLERLGWSRRYTTVFCAASAPLGYMIPPNVNACIFALVSSASVAALFLAAIVPGLIWGAGYVALNAVIYKKWYKSPSPEQLAKAKAEQGAYSNGSGAAPVRRRRLAAYLNTFETNMHFGAATIKALPAMFMPIIIIGGIYSGLFTPTEAGAVSAVYAIIAGIFIFQRFTLRTTAACFTDTARSLGVLMIIFPCVMIFTKILLLNGLPNQFAAFVSGLEIPRFAKLLIIDLLFIIGGCLFDAPVLTLVIPTLLMPTMTALGVGPVQFGVIVFMAIGIGAMTPPMAASLFIASRVGRVSISDMIGPLLPFLFIVAIPVMVLVTFIPELSTWLPDLIMGTRR